MEKGLKKQLYDNRIVACRNRSDGVSMKCVGDGRHQPRSRVRCLQDGGASAWRNAAFHEGPREQPRCLRALITLRAQGDHAASPTREQPRCLRALITPEWKQG